jgi:hypothetical protein
MNIIKPIYIAMIDGKNEAKHLPNNISLSVVGVARRGSILF